VWRRIRRAIDALQGRGVTGAPKNLIFASNGPKPEIGFRDLRLGGYEIYRFGANELAGDGAHDAIAGFF
jgi:hypothetical protein